MKLGKGIKKKKCAFPGDSQGMGGSVAIVREKRKTYRHISSFHRHFFRCEFFALCGATAKSRAKLDLPATNNCATKLAGFGDVAARIVHVIDRFSSIISRDQGFFYTRGVLRTSTEREVALIEGVPLKTL